MYLDVQKRRNKGVEISVDIKEGLDIGNSDQLSFHWRDFAERSFQTVVCTL